MEWRSSKRQDEEEHTKAKDVGGLCLAGCVPCLINLRCHIGLSPQLLGDEIVAVCGESKVAKFEIAFL